MKIHTVQLNLADLSGGTAHMDATELGAYVSLFLTCYQIKDYKLPADDSRLARIAKCSPKVWTRIRQSVMSKFVPGETDGIPHFTHKRVLEDAAKYLEKSTKNRANALKGHESRKPFASQSDCERTTTQEPRTKNHTSEAKASSGRARKRSSPSITLDDLSLNHIEEWLLHKRTQGKYVHHDEHFILEYFKNYCKSKGKTYDDYIAALRNAFEWSACQPKSGGSARSGNRQSNAKSPWQSEADRLRAKYEAEAQLERQAEIDGNASQGL